MDKEHRLRQLARAALIRTRGDLAQAIGRLDADVIKSDDIELERALTASWREYALRQVLDRNLSDLQEEGILPRPDREPASRQDASRSQTWAHSRVREMEERARKRNYLDDFKVNGEPIGDLTPESVLAKAGLYERDARFMRLVASGVPPQSRIRDYVTPEEAAQRWEMAQAQPPQPEIDARQARLLRLLTRAPGIKDEEYRAAQARVKELQGLPAPSQWDSIELDALARVMSEYETAHE